MRFAAQDTQEKQKKATRDCYVKLYYFHDEIVALTEAKAYSC